MRALTSWFDEYSESHRNLTNQKIHFICVPAIFFSVLGLLWAIPGISMETYRLPWTLVVIALASIYYFMLSVKLGILMLLISLGCCAVLWQMEQGGLSVLWISVAIFVVAWIGQAYGHKLEGKKPSFLKDLVFLLIGPLWILQKVLNKLSA